MSNYIGVNPDGPASGDLTGNYPGPRVDKIDGVSATDIKNGAAAGATALQPAGSGASLTGVVKNSSVGKSRGTCYQTAAGSVGSTTGGTFYAWQGTFAADDLVDFTHNAGVLTYTGTETKVFIVQYSGLHRNGGTGGWLDNGVSINGNDPAAYTFRPFKGAGAATEQTACCTVTLSTGDTVNMAVKAGTGTTDLYWDLRCSMTICE